MLTDMPPALLDVAHPSNCRTNLICQGLLGPAPITSSEPRVHPAETALDGR